MVSWSKKWDLPLNFFKAVALHSGETPQTPYLCNSTTIQYQEQFRDLEECTRQRPRPTTTPLQNICFATSRIRHASQEKVLEGGYQKVGKSTTNFY
ncbi:hypothetical protein RB195_022010 [Necator americanus]|uniref:Uncharacterized protein n=1 Tax=Necator americanus TaxID=51031 RepID=A0ABR1EDL6_NECAM